MGICGSTSSNKQILICGLQNSGKTTFLRMLKRKPGEKLGEIFPTIGFNFEEIKEKESFIGFWDVGGKETVKFIFY